MKKSTERKRKDLPFFYNGFVTNYGTRHLCDFLVHSTSIFLYHEYFELILSDSRNTTKNLICNLIVCMEITKGMIIFFFIEWRLNVWKFL